MVAIAIRLLINYLLIILFQTWCNMSKYIHIKGLSSFFRWCIFTIEFYYTSNPSTISTATETHSRHISNSTPYFNILYVYTNKGSCNKSLLSPVVTGELLSTNFWSMTIEPFPNFDKDDGSANDAYNGAVFSSSHCIDRWLNVSR